MPTRVLITRESAEPLQGLLEAGGMDVVHVALVELEATGALPPEGEPEVVVITSAAVARFLPDLAAHIGAARVAAVGAATAEALAATGLHPHRVGQAGGAGLIDGLPSSGGPLWYVGATDPSKGVRAALDAYSGPVGRWPVYTNQLPDGAAEALQGAGPVDLVVLTSASAARRYATLVGAEAVPVAVLGDSTEKAACSAGLQVAICAPVPRLSALAEAILGCYAPCCLSR